MPERYPSSNGAGNRGKGSPARTASGIMQVRTAGKAPSMPSCDMQYAKPRARPDWPPNRILRPAAVSSLGSRAPWSANRVCPSSHAHLVTELRQSLRTDALDFQKLVDVVEPSYLCSIVEDALRGDRSDAFEGLQFA